MRPSSWSSGRELSSRQLEAERLGSVVRHRTYLCDRLLIMIGVAHAQQDQPLAQYQAELTKTAQERDAGADYVAALLTQLADAKMQAAAANQQIAAGQARITNLVKENLDLGCLGALSHQVR